MADLIWIYGEVIDNAITSNTLEMVTKAAQVGTAEVILLGAAPDAAVDELGAHGATRVYRSADPVFDEFLVLPAVEAVAQLIAAHNPTAVLFASSYTGRDVAAGLCAKLDCGAISDVGDFAINNSRVEATIPALGGAYAATSTIERAGTKLLLVRPKSFEASRTGGTATVENVAALTDASLRKVQVVDRVEVPVEGPQLEGATNIVSGGRGLKSAESFQMLHELAELIGGAVGATRAVVDAQWVPYSMQIGQTGKTVKPNVYIACGISGAIQHLAGMKTSKAIIAINTDPQAPIFTVSDLGVVGDVFKVVPQLIDEIKRRKGVA
jgi:electron transfer flavoprotein alpha subunit